MSLSKLRSHAAAPLAAGIFLLLGSPAAAQVTPAAGVTPADDTPSVKVGGTIYASYVYTQEPTTTDADGNVIHPSSFDITRAYINVTGNISHLISYRITPDITRESTSATLGAGEKVSSSLDGSLTFRLKYTFGQFNLDDAWASKGSWARLGLQQTPYIAWMEDIYRYRFQGQLFEESEKYMTSSDFGLSTQYRFPGNFGEVHGGYYNGDGYSKGDANDQKAIQIRATLRPVPNGGAIRGLRFTAFYDADNYAKNDDKTRLILNSTFENKHINAGADWVQTKDRATAASAEMKGEGWSLWATPRFGKGWEALLRWDSLKPDKDNTPDARKQRKIAGVAYWFPSQKIDSAALLLDYENVTYNSTLLVAGVNPPDEKRYGLHALFSF